jgi:hypothetical protein
VPFVAPDPRARTGPHTECLACGYGKGQHGPDGQCPEAPPLDAPDQEPAA